MDILEMKVRGAKNGTYFGIGTKLRIKNVKKNLTNSKADLFRYPKVLKIGHLRRGHAGPGEAGFWGGAVDSGELSTAQGGGWGGKDRPFLAISSFLGVDFWRDHQSGESLWGVPRGPPLQSEELEWTRGGLGDPVQK